MIVGSCLPGPTANFEVYDSRKLIHEQIYSTATVDDHYFIATRGTLRCYSLEMASWVPNSNSERVWRAYDIQPLREHPLMAAFAHRQSDGSASVEIMTLGNTSSYRLNIQGIDWRGPQPRTPQHLSLAIHKRPYPVIALGDPDFGLFFWKSPRWFERVIRYVVQGQILQLTTCGDQFISLVQRPSDECEIVRFTFDGKTQITEKVIGRIDIKPKSFLLNGPFGIVSDGERLEIFFTDGEECMVSHLSFPGVTHMAAFQDQSETPWLLSLKNELVILPSSPWLVSEEAVKMVLKTKGEITSITASTKHLILTTTEKKNGVVGRDDLFNVTIRPYAWE